MFWGVVRNIAFQTSVFQNTAVQNTVVQYTVVNSRTARKWTPIRLFPSQIDRFAYSATE